MPELAKVADKFSVVRSITRVFEEHDASHSASGWSFNSLREMGGRPSVGSVMSKLWGVQATPHGACPTFVDLTGWMRPGFLGQINSGFRPDSEGRAQSSLNSSVSNLRLNDRQSLLGGLDRIRREIDGRGMMTAMDSFTQAAPLTSSHRAKWPALDLRNEDPRALDRYGLPDRVYGSLQNFVLARRLIQAGVRCVGLSWGGWDTHGNNFGHLRMQLPRLDRWLAALIEDLDAHGLLDSTLILMSGEFGPTPRVNGGAGRDHWPATMSFFLAGGGMKHGQMIGTTNRNGEYPVERPIHIQHVFHTAYHWLGIDANTVTITDPNGRPQYLADEREIVRELV